MRMGLGIGLGIAHSGARPYAFTNAEAAALVARFTTPPTDARKKLIDTLVGSLKTAGVWAKLDALYVMAAADSQAARRNWVQDAYNLTAVNTPTFTADRGYAGDGASSYWRTGFIPATAGGQLSQNSAHIAVWSRTDVDGGYLDLSARNASQANDVSILVRASNTMTGRMCALSTVALNSSNSTSLGHFIANRSGASAVQNYVNGSSVGTGTAASSGIPTVELYGAARNENGSPSNFSPRQYAAMHLGGSLTATDAGNIYNALSTYLTAIGAN